MWAAWTVGIRIITTGNTAQAFNSIANGATLANARTMTLQRNVTALSGAIKTGLTVAAVAGVAGIMEGIKTAVNLQTALVGVQTATRATTAEMVKMKQAAYEMSNVTAQSVVDSANILKVLGQQGFTPKQVLTLAMPTAKAADALWASKGVDFAQGAGIFTSIAHLFGTTGTNAQNGGDVRPIYDMAQALFMHTKDDPKTLLNQLSYMVSQSQALGIDPSQTMGAMMVASRYGFGRGKGGTNIADLISASLGGLQLTKHAQLGKIALLDKIGLLDSSGRSKFMDPTGQHYDLIGFLTQLHTWATGVDPKTGHTRRRDDVTETFKSAFGIQGARIGDLALMSNFLQMLRQSSGTIKDAVARPGHKGAVETTYEAYFSTVGVQWKRLMTNFTNVLGTIMDPYLYRIKTGIMAIADYLGNLTNYLQSHPIAAKAAGSALIGGTLLAGGGAAFAGTVIARRMLAILMGATPAEAAAAAGSGSGVVGGLSAIAKNAGGAVGSIARFRFSGTAAGQAMGALHARQLAAQGMGGDFMAKFVADLPEVVRVLTGVGAAIGFLGDRAIPVVGEVLLAVQAMQFLSKHAGQLGYYLGVAAGWIVRYGAPMFCNAIWSVIKIMAKGIWDAFVWLLKGLLQSIIGFVTGSFQGGIWDFLRKFGSGAGAGFMSQMPTDLAPNIAGRKPNFASPKLTINFNLPPAPSGSTPAEKRAIDKHNRAISKASAVIHADTIRGSAYSAGSMPAVLTFSQYESRPGN